MERYVKEERIYKGHRVRIMQDEDPQDPRKEWDNTSAMVCWHSRYSLGDSGVRWNKRSQLSEWYNEPIDLLYELAGLCREDEQELREGSDISNEELYRLIEEKGNNSQHTLPI